MLALTSFYVSCHFANFHLNEPCVPLSSVAPYRIFSLGFSARLGSFLALYVLLTCVSASKHNVLSENVRALYSASGRR